MLKELDIEQLKTYLTPRHADCHKGTFGHVLVIGGCLGYSGSVRLAGEAALRVGAGCVSLATRPEHASLLNLTCPELMCHGIEHSEQILPLLDRATVVIIGPGLSMGDWGRRLLAVILKQSDKPTLFDADALNLLAANPTTLPHARAIFTPHPGEAARLLQTTSALIQQDRLSAIQKIRALLGGTIVLKGAGTLILSEDNKPAICRAGNAGMATAGMGDVLSGIIGGLIAQHIPLADAAKLGVWVHATAGDLAATSGKRGMIASDLVRYLREVVNP